MNRGREWIPEEPGTVESTNYKQGRWKKSVKDATEHYIRLCRTAIDQGKSVAMGKNPE